MRKFVCNGSLVLAVSFTIPVFAQNGNNRTANSSTSASQLALEKQFDGLIDAQHIGQHIKLFSAKPHAIGSPQGKLVAEQILAAFKSYGWDAKIETYHVLFPTPKVRVLELTAPTTYKALLKEPALKEDGTSNQEGQLPTYNAWSADGDVTAELVYVNYGIPADYEQLEKLGVDVKGKIVIARYGRSWRGIKPKIAQEHGAIGCIIYADPKEDGYFQGEVYPRGAFKNEYGVQRGSVMDIVKYPGDPLTPGTASTENAQRLDRLSAPNLLKIPVLPISYHDAKPLLAALEGPVPPADWRGALPITYHVGPGKAKVHLKVEFNWDIKPAYNVIATIKGAQYPDQWVIRGNHHDAWVNGAADPVSGLASLLEEAKAIGELVKNGHQFKRTLVYCAWDGEEPGLLGSTEWVEDHQQELQEKTVAYINTDGNGRGFLEAGGSHALEGLISDISKQVTDPQTQTNVFERSRAEIVAAATSAKTKKELLTRDGYKLSALGSGSDYSTFLQHAGIPVLNLAFGGEDAGGEYHSIYDSYDLFVRFKDPGFVYGVALSQVAGRAAIRLADADVLPFDFRKLHKTISGYVNELTAQLETERENTQVENQLISSNVYTLAADPTEKLVAPKAKDEVPFIDFSPLQNALSAFEKSASHLADTLAKSGNTAYNARLNKALFQAEQQLLTEQGLPRRSWYKHTIYAPGFYTGYGVKTLPGIREAIEQRNWKEAEEQIAVVAASVNKLTAYLNNIALK